MGRAKEILVKVIPAKIANEFVKKHHYSGKVYLIEFEAPLSMADFEGIRGNPTKTITVTTNNKTFKGWVRSVGSYPEGIVIFIVSNTTNTGRRSYCSN